MSLIAIALGTALAGQDACDLNPSPECTAQRVAAATARLGLTDITEDARSGATVYRVIFEDGDRLPAVSFERRPGQSPELIVYGTGGRTIRMPITAALWLEAGKGSGYVGRDLVENGYSIECVIQKMTTVQIARPGAGEGASEIMRELSPPTASSHSQTTCGGGLTVDFGLRLTELACSALPECAAMGDERNWEMTAAENLGAAFLLRGDTVAAAALFHQRGGPLSGGGRPVEAARWDKWLNPAYGATLDWNGQTTTSKRAYDDVSASPIAVFLAQSSRDDLDLEFEPTAIGANDPDSGWIEGLASYSLQVDGVWRAMRAPYRQEWDAGDGWRLKSWTVGPFQAAPR